MLCCYFKLCCVVLLLQIVLCCVVTSNCVVLCCVVLCCVVLCCVVLCCVVLCCVVLCCDSVGTSNYFVLLNFNIAADCTNFILRKKKPVKFRGAVSKSYIKPCGWSSGQNFISM